MRGESPAHRTFLKTVGVTSSVGMLGLAGWSKDGGAGQTQVTYGSTEGGSAPDQLGRTWANEIQGNTDYEVSVQPTGGFP